MAWLAMAAKIFFSVYHSLSLTSDMQLWHVTKSVKHTRLSRAIDHAHVMCYDLSVLHRYQGPYYVVDIVIREHRVTNGPSQRQICTNNRSWWCSNSYDKQILGKTNYQNFLRKHSVTKYWHHLWYYATTARLSISGKFTCYFH